MGVRVWLRGDVMLEAGQAPLYKGGTPVML